LMHIVICRIRTPACGKTIDSAALASPCRCLGVPFRESTVPSKHSIGAVIYINHRDRWRCEFQCYPGELFAVGRLLAWPMAIILILEHFVSHRQVQCRGLETLLAIYLQIARRSFRWRLARRGHLGVTQYIFTSPLSRALGGMDVGFELRIVLGAFAYLVLRRAEVNVSRR
jgi:hypothetical protein